MKKSFKIRFSLSIIFLIIGVILKFMKIENLMYEMTLLSIISFLISYFVIGIDILNKALKNIFRGNIFDENFLMMIATIGALVIGEFPEAIAVMLLYQIGEEFQSIAVGKSRDAIKELMEIKPEHANVVRNKEVVAVRPEEVEIGEIILIKPGEKVPVDSRILVGKSSFDTKTITGEPVPKTIGPQEIIYSGTINLNKVVEAKVMKKFEDSTVSKILELVEEATSKKAKTEKFITKFAKYYTPIVCFLALALAVLPTVVFNQNFSEWLYRALTFLVISCPCALVISVPLGFFGGIGGASKNGILIKGSNYLEALSEARYIAEQELIRIAAHAEKFSNHPIAISIKEKYAGKYDEKKIQNLEEISGKGIKANIFFKDTLVGNAKLLMENDIVFKEEKEPGTVIYIAVENKYKGCILISDTVKKEAKEAIFDLSRAKIKESYILTGDEERYARQVAKDVDIKNCFGNLLPEQKLEKLEEIMKQKKKKERAIFVGDGINDSPCLARADVGIAMGGIGADAAIEAADVVIMTDELTKIAQAIRISKETMKIVKQNIVFALIIKISVLILGALGFANMWLAVFADVGVSIIAILNSMKTLKIK